MATASGAGVALGLVAAARQPYQSRHQATLTRRQPMVFVSCEPVAKYRHDRARPMTPKHDKGGFSIDPNPFDNVPSDTSTYTDEVLGPARSVLQSIEDALSPPSNDNPYGSCIAISATD